MRLLFAITVCSFCAVLWVALAIARRVRRSQFTASGPLLGMADKTATSPPLPFRPRGRASIPNDPVVHPPVPRHVVAREFFEAGEFRTPRPLRLEQEIFQQKPRRALAEITFPAKPVVQASKSATDYSVTDANTPAASASPDVPGPRLAEPIPIRPAQAYASLFGQTVPIASIEQAPQTRRHLETSAPEILPPIAEAAAMPAQPVSLPLPFMLHRRPPQSARPSGLRRRIDLSQYSNDMGDLTDPYTSALRGSGTQGPVPAIRRDL